MNQGVSRLRLKSSAKILALRDETFIRTTTEAALAGESLEQNSFNPPKQKIKTFIHGLKTVVFCEGRIKSEYLIKFS